MTVDEKLCREILLKFPADPHHLANWDVSTLVKMFPGRTGSVYGDIEDCVLHLQRMGYLRASLHTEQSYEGVSRQVGWIHGLTEKGIRYRNS